MMLCANEKRFHVFLPKLALKLSGCFIYLFFYTHALDSIIKHSYMRWIVTPVCPCHLFFEKASNEDEFVFSSALPSKPYSCFLQPMSKLYYFGLHLVPLSGLTRVSAGCDVMDFPLRMFQISPCGFHEEVCVHQGRMLSDWGKIFDRDLFILFF